MRLHDGLALLLLGLAQPAAAEQPGYGESVATAKALMLSGRPAEAQSLLDDLAARYPGSNDVDFLRGMLAVEAADYDSAVRHFRSILVRQPNAVRVRLELARALYLDRDYENAFRHFQFARAGNRSPGVNAAIDRFLGAIRREKSWSYTVSMSIAPDTNINNGTSAQETTIFGLPFELGDDTRQKSGIGLATSAAFEFSPRLNENTRLNVGAAIDRREYRGGDFDDMTIAVHGGPQVVLDRWDLKLIGTAFRRTFGGERLSEGFGAKAEATRYSNAKTAITVGIAAHNIRYPQYDLQSGWAFSGWARLEKALTASSSLSARIGASRKTAEVPELAYRTGSVALGYYRDLPGGFSIYAEPSFLKTRYDAVDPFFGERRRDNLFELRLAALNRRFIVLSRFTPRISLTLARRNSSIDLYDFTQRRLEAGFTSSF